MAIPHRHYIIADARERAVVLFLESALTTSHLITGRQVNTGDYLICRSTTPPTISACIERKTLQDFAASFKDGRHANIQKMRNLQASTGCQLYYIIEGPAFPALTRRFAHIPYANILSAITNLMVRDNIMVIQTEDEMHTAKRLADLVKAYDISGTPRPRPLGSEIALKAGAPSPALPLKAAPSPSEAGAPSSASEAGAPSPTPPSEAGTSSPTPPSEAGAGGTPETNLTIPECLTAVLRQPDDEAIVVMWSQLKGISAIMGKIISQKFSVADLVMGKVTDAQLADLRTPTGRVIHKQGLNSLREVVAGLNTAAISLISGIRGFSRDCAVLIIKEMSLVKIVNLANAKDCSNILLPRGTKTAKLGLARTNRLQQLLNWSGPRSPNNAGPKKPPIMPQEAPNNAPRSPQ